MYCYFNEYKVFIKSYHTKSRQNIPDRLHSLGKSCLDGEDMWHGPTLLNNI